MLRSSIILIILLIFLFGPSSWADTIDTKYFCSFSYKQKGFMESDYSFWPEARFDRQITRFYYYHVRTGFLFHPQPWLDFGLFYKYVSEMDDSDRWIPENRVEFNITPKIMFGFNLFGNGIESISGEVVGDEGGGVIGWVGKKAFQLVQVAARNEIEFRDLDIQDLSKVHAVYRVRPRISWQQDYGVLYVGDEVFYSLKYGEIFQNWARIGVIRPINGIDLDMFYMYESERRQTYSSEWDHAHVFGARFDYTRE
ncbi:hypothetical protein ACFLZ2_05910 [Candidatus Margulisiibacteriota bacterium]